MMKKISVMKDEYKDLQNQLREKEQENRVARLKVKELKRMIRQSKLKPVELTEKPS